MMIYFSPVSCGVEPEVTAATCTWIPAGPSREGHVTVTGGEGL